MKICANQGWGFLIDFSLKIDLNRKNRFFRFDFWNREKSILFSFFSRKNRKSFFSLFRGNFLRDFANSTLDIWKYTDNSRKNTFLYACAWYEGKGSDDNALTSTNRDSESKSLILYQNIRKYFQYSMVNNNGD